MMKYFEQLKTPVAKAEASLWWSLGWPMSVSIGSRLGIMLTDVAVLGHLGTEYLAGASLANIWIIATSTFVWLGFSGALNTLTSQAIGAKNHSLAGAWLLIALICVSITSVFIALAWGFGTPALRVLGFDNERELELATTFARWNILSAWPTVVHPCLNAWLMAQKIVKPPMYINLVMILVNGLLNYILVHGIGPQQIFSLGFIGSPIATSLSRWFLLASITIYIFKTGLITKFFGNGRWHPNVFCTRSRAREYVLKQSLPLFLGRALEEWQIQTIAAFAAHLGTIQLSAHTSMLNMYFFSTSLLYGFLNATRVRIGYHLGRGNVSMAKLVMKIDMAASTIVSIVVSVLFVTLNKYLGYIFSDDPDVRAKFAKLAFYCGPAYIQMALFYVVMGILDGMGRPAAIGVAFLIGAWGVCVPLAYILAYIVKLDLSGLWVGLICGYFVVIVVASIRLLTLRWEDTVEDAQKRSEVKQDVAQETCVQDSHKYQSLDTPVVDDVHTGDSFLVEQVHGSDTSRLLVSTSNADDTSIDDRFTSLTVSDTSKENQNNGASV